MATGRRLDACLAVLCATLCVAAGERGRDITEDVKACQPVSLSETLLPPVLFPGKIEQMYWFGKDDLNVFAITLDPTGKPGGTLWRNQYNGDSAHWVDMTEKLKALLPPDVPSQMRTAASNVVQLIHHPSDPKYFFIRGVQQYHWYSKDMGRTFSLVQSPPGIVVNVKPHPFKPEMVLSLIRRLECYGDDRLTNPMCLMDLFISDDYGDTWANLTAQSRGKVAGFVDYEWGVLANKTVGAKSPLTILATVYEYPPGAGSSFVGWDSRVAFVRSDDLFKEKHEKLVNCGNQFEAVGGNVYLAVTNDCPASGKKANPWESRNTRVTLKVSVDLGDTFDEICFPVAIDDRGYTLMDVADGSVLIGVDHDEEDAIEARAPIGNIYSSGTNEAMFSLSLKHDYQVGSLLDFTRIHGMPGTFVANEVDVASFDDPYFGTKTSYNDYVMTKITFNKGSKWQDIQPPSLDVDQHSYVCHGQCRLHLHGPVSWTSYDGGRTQPLEASVYSHENSPGIVMGMGNVGKYLDNDASRVNTYLSRDGGQEWFEVKRGPYIFEFGDHGGIIVIAKYSSSGPTDHLEFSLDDGRCWEGPVYFDTPMEVHNIRVEPKGASHRFIVHGQECLDDLDRPAFNGGKRCNGVLGQPPKGIAYFFDAQQVVTQFVTCAGTDYEEWSPCKDFCLLGQNLTYHRQKPDALCFNGESWQRERRIPTSNCTCVTALDTECDFGSERDHEGVCKPILGLVPKDICPLVRDGKYHLSETGRRLIAHNKCTNVTAIIADVDTTTGAPIATAGGRGHGAGGTFARRFLGFVVLCGLAGGGFFAWQRVDEETKDRLVPPSVRDGIGGALGAARDAAEGAVGWVADQLAALRGGGPGMVSGGDHFQPLSGGDEFDVDEEDVDGPMMMR